MSTINIVLEHTRVGSVRFIQPPGDLEAVRTAAGLRIEIPVEITLQDLPNEGPELLLRNLQATLFAEDRAGGRFEIGRATSHELYYGGHSDLQRTLSLSLPDSAYFFYEKLRDGREPRFYLDVSGELCRLIKLESNRPTLCSQPSIFHGSGQVSYSSDVWTKMLRQINLKDAVVVEIPFPTSPPSPWEPVWQAIHEARVAFDRGGDTGWQACVTRTRIALEEWKNNEGEEVGAEKPKERTKQQRLNNLRKSLREIAHLAVHGSEGNSVGRDDALLMLATVCALLAVRNP